MLDIWWVFPGTTNTLKHFSLMLLTALQETVDFADVCEEIKIICNIFSKYTFVYPTNGGIAETISVYEHFMECFSM